MNQKICWMKLLFPVSMTVLLAGVMWLGTPRTVVAVIKPQLSTVATLRIYIDSVQALDDFDDCALDEIFNCKSPADLKAVVTIAGERFESEIIKDQDVITPSDWIFSKQIAVSGDGTQTVQAKVEIWDSDEDFDGGDDDPVDLDPDSDEPLNLTINLNDCIENLPGAIAGNFDTAKSCQATITSQGNIGNPARITFRVTADTLQDQLIVTDITGASVANAEIRHFRNNIYRGTFFTDLHGQVPAPCLQKGDELVAMQLMYTQVSTDVAHHGWHSKTYLTSFDYDATTGEALPYVVGSRQCATTPIELTVKPTSPLILFNLIVSVGWGAEIPHVAGADFISQLQRALIRANETLFDVTDGHFAFGEVRIHTGREHWDLADIQISPSNYRRPYAIPGGITRGQPYTYTSSTSLKTVFYPGYIRIGRAWNQYGSPEAGLDQPDGYRMLAHEFAHYALMLLDEYFYFDETYNLHSADCPGSLMADAYRPDAELDFQGNLLWTDACRLTEQYQRHGESAWETMVRVYADRLSPPRWQFRLPYELPKAGPTQFPFNLTAFSAPPPRGPNDLNNDTGLARLTIRTGGGRRSYTGQTQVFTLRKNERNVLRVFEQGTVNGVGEIELVSLKDKDIILANSWDGVNLGTTRFITGTDPVLNLEQSAWNPLVTVRPIQDAANGVTGLALEVQQVGALEGKLMAALVPLFGVVTITDAITLTPSGPDTYTGLWPLSAAQPLDEGFLWIGDVQSKEQIYENLTRQTVLPMTLGGSPDSHKRSYPPRHPSSSDGYCQLHVPDATWSANLPIIVLSPHSLPLLDSPQRLASAPCYIGVPTATETFTQPVALTIYYNREATQSIPHEQVRIYHWDASAHQWQLIEHNVHEPKNFLISAKITKPGLYVAMQAFSPQVILHGRAPNQGPVANVFTGATAASTTAALRNCQNGAVFDLANSEVEQFYTDAPSYVNNLAQLQGGRTYYARVDEECTITFGEGVSAVSATPLGEPTRAYTVPVDLLPMTLYGTVKAGWLPGPSGKVITVLVNDKPVATTMTKASAGETVYVLTIRVEEMVKVVGNDIAGQSLTLNFDEVAAEASITWQPGVAQSVHLTTSASEFQNFLPLVTR